MARRAPSTPRGLAGSLRAFIPRRRGTLWIGGLVLSLGLLGTAARVRSTKRLYRSEATVVYEPGVLQAAHDSPQQIELRLREMLTERPRLERLIEDMRLLPAVVARRGLAEAIDETRARVEMTAREGTTFGVSYDDEDGDRARAVLNRLVSGVVDDDTQRRQHDAEAARQILETERQQVDRDLQTKETRLAALSPEHPRPATTGAVAVADRARGVAITAEVAVLEQRSAELEQRLAQSSGPSSPQDTAKRAGAAPGAAPAVVAARAQVAANLLVVERDLDDKQTRLPYQHPDVKAAQRQVEEARAALRKADAAVAASAAAAAAPPAAKAVSSERLASLHRALDAVRARIETLKAQNSPSPPAPDAARKAANTTAETAAPETTEAHLTRDISEARERRRQLEARLFQAQLASTLGAAGQGGGLVVSEPSVEASHPIAGRRTRVGLVGASMSALLALLAMMVAGRLDGRLYDPDDIARALGPKVVVVVPKLGIKLVSRSAARITDTGA